MGDVDAIGAVPSSIYPPMAKQPRTGNSARARDSRKWKESMVDCATSRKDPCEWTSREGNEGASARLCGNDRCVEPVRI